MVVGCSFIMAFGFEIFFEEFYDNWWGDGSVNLDMKYHGQNIGVFTRRSLVFYEAFMSSACFLSLGGLCLWHARLISAGQTSIEAHINRSEEKRLAELGKIYRNPYNFGARHNWYLFLGNITNTTSFIVYGWCKPFIPSRHIHSIIKHLVYYTTLGIVKINIFEHFKKYLNSTNIFLKTDNNFTQ